MAARNIRVRGIKRKQVDEDKLALAFLLLAKIICEQDESDITDRHSPTERSGTAMPTDSEAA